MTLKIPEGMLDALLASAHPLSEERPMSTQVRLK